MRKRLSILAALAAASMIAVATVMPAIAGTSVRTRAGNLHPDG